ncbi:DUF928 domain-containing protein [Laspinema sp. D1]|uniref:DUF928 domain-containing protein n=1 Tax=Laspinema palackyanum D2a TaxID=2953684 RepID=A0ABT2MUE2_9CYAN|nr:DUF928 domain-containing protein [Laspinema sp. D2b]MCT7968366.1 DUF928 domain-containing protein [Laspinema sp. D2a]
MARKNYQGSWVLCSIALSLNLAFVAALPSRAQVSSPFPGPQTLARVTFEPPTNERLNDSAGGASRQGGFCPQDGMVEGPSLMPILPDTKEGLTVSERPTLFVYVPQTKAAQGYFILKDETEDYYYQTQVSIPQEGGIVRLTLPESAPALEVGTTYQWSFVVACELPARADSPRVEGWLQRVEPTAKLNNYRGVDSIEAATSYGAEGIWYDAVTTLAHLRQSQPETYNQEWVDFLSSVGLENVANEPILEP